MIVVLEKDDGIVGMEDVSFFNLDHFVANKVVVIVRGDDRNAGIEDVSFFGF